MRLAVPCLLLAAAASMHSAPAPVPGSTQPEGAPPAPRLFVMLVVDQMRADYLEVFGHRWKHGLATLREQGTVFERTEYPFLNTVTCAGHATIGTGTFPHMHGMVLNAWWSREQRALVSCTEDAAAPVISYGGKTPATAGGRLLLVPTFADRLRAQHPNSRVVALSLKPRSAITLAGRAGTVVMWAPRPQSRRDHEDEDEEDRGHGGR